jgi:hypothetical protein
LLTGDQITVCTVVVLKRRLYEYTFAGDSPTDVVQHLLNSSSSFSHAAVVSELTQVGFGEFCVSKLFIDDVDKL